VHTPTSGLYIWGTSQIFPDTRPDTPRPSTLFHVFLCLPSPDHICPDQICPDTFPMPQPICTVLYSIYMVISDVNICRPNSEALVHRHICVARVRNKYVQIHFRSSSPYALFCIPLYMVSQESGIVTFLLDVCPTWTRGVALWIYNDEVRYVVMKPRDTRGCDKSTRKQQ
jgi:hypothetical protein